MADSAPAQTQAQAAPPPLTIRDLCIWMGQVKSSDLHLKAGRPPIVRVDGDLRPFNLPKISGATIETLMAPIMSKKVLREFQETNEADFSYMIPGEARFRVNMFRQRGEAGVVMRRIPIKIPTAKELGLPPVINDLADSENGIVLVTGPTGSGKSTTLAAMVDRINDTRAVHIMTIEDPIEFVYEDKVAAINQRELGIDTESLDAALKAVLRQDPDIILMGEMRDRKTIQFGITAAETGHLVFATLHTNSAVQTLERVLDMTDPELRDATRVQLSQLIRGVVCQRLVKRLNGGRAAAQEIMVVNETIRQLIAENRIHDVEQAVEEGEYYGMQTFNQALVKLIEQGVIDQKTALDNTEKPAELELLFKGVNRGVNFDAMAEASKEGPVGDEAKGYEGGIDLVDEDEQDAPMDDAKPRW